MQRYERRSCILPKITWLHESTYISMFKTKTVLYKIQIAYISYFFVDLYNHTIYFKWYKQSSHTCLYSSYGMKKKLKYSIIKFDTSSESVILDLTFHQPTKRNLKNHKLLRMKQLWFILLLHECDRFVTM